MFRNLSHIIRQPFCAFLSPLQRPILLNPICIAGAYISSPCINSRLQKCDLLNEYNSSTKEQNLFETNKRRNKGLNDKSGSNFMSLEEDKEKRKNFEEYFSGDSDGEDNDIEPSLHSLNVNFLSFRRGSKAARKQIQQCLTESSVNGNILVKNVRKVASIMEKGIKPEKIYFSILNDLVELNMPMDGIELYRIHPLDAPLEMQKRRGAPFLAIFKANRLKCDSSNKSTLPLTLICDAVNHSGKLEKIIAAAKSCGCDEIVISSGSSKTHKRLKSTELEPYKDLFPIKDNQSWDDIEASYLDDSNIFVLQIGVLTKNLVPGNMNIPNISFTNVDAWTTDRVILICTEFLSEEALKFCRDRNGREIIIPGATDDFCSSAMSVAAITLDLRKQWEMKNKMTTTR